jgi:hypothetical protein
LILYDYSEEEDEDMEPLKRKKSTHASATSSEAHTSEQPPKPSGPPPKIISWTCPENSEHVEITRDDKSVEKVSIATDELLVRLKNDELHQMISVENKDERSQRNHRILMHMLHGYFSSKDPSLLPINPQSSSVVPLQVVDPTSITTWGYLSNVDKVTIRRGDGQFKETAVAELSTLSTKDVKEMMAIATPDTNPSLEQYKILSILKRLTEDEI